MMNETRAGLLTLLACTSFALATDGRPGGFMTTTTVPPALISAVEGCWDLAPQYRIILHRAGDTLRVQQQSVDRLGKRVLRTEEVRYKPDDNTLGFSGIGNIHRVVVMLRPADEGLESAFSAEISPGKWTSGTWERATRCTATTLDDDQAR